MTLDNVQALPLGTQLGDYRLDAVIGHGGFGITYRAFDRQLAKVVAVKEYLPVEFAVRRADGQVVPRGARYADDFAWGRERFLDEARALARFRHPHIVPVLRFLEANGTAYTVMEFEDGRSVAEWLRETGRRLPVADVRRLAEGLLSGLYAVHAQGFLHRDIKPSNIIIRRDGVPILIDFGAARQAMGGRTRTLTSVLTPQYAPIEQYALDGKQGPWSDIYSAAAVLHHAVAGQPPPEAASRISQDPYRPLAVTKADRFDQTFLAAIDRGLAFAPEQRPQSIEAWRALFGGSLLGDDTPTQRMTPARAPASGPAAGPGGAGFANTQAARPCNNSIYGDVGPQVQRTNIMMHASQILGGRLTVSDSLVYNDLHTLQSNGPGTLSLATAFGPGSGKGGQINPFFQAPGSAPATNTEQVSWVDLLNPLPTTRTTEDVIYNRLNATYNIDDNFHFDLDWVIGQNNYTSGTYDAFCSSCAFLALNGTALAGGSTTTTGLSAGAMSLR